MPGHLAAFIDDFAPAAVVDLPGHQQDHLAWRVFFQTADARNAALAALGAAVPWRAASARAIDVPDERWAERSQAALTAIRVGRVIVTPPWDTDAAARLAGGVRAEGHAPVVLVVEPSMGFGTGHHESTRLCLEALQSIELAGRTVLDLGTGSGVLAVAAARLGCRAALAIDADPDAVAAATDTVARNGAGDRVEARLADLASAALPPADVVVANLTGALLRREAARISACAGPDGLLVVSGFTAEERLAVAHAYQPFTVHQAWVENGWVALTLGRGSTASP